MLLVDMDDDDLVEADEFRDPSLHGRDLCSADMLRDQDGKAREARLHFCRALKESTGLSPHAWPRQHELDQAMNVPRDTDAVSLRASLSIQQ